MSNIENIKDLMRKHGYQVVLKVKSGIVTAKFPKRAIKPECQPFSNVYSVVKDGVKVVTDDDLTEVIKVPKYAQRVIILTDIARICRIIRYNTNLISFNVDDKEVTYKEFKDSLLKPKLTKAQLAKEQTLEEFVRVGMANGFPDELGVAAKTNKIAEGYKVVRGILIAKD